MHIHLNFMVLRVNFPHNPSSHLSDFATQAAADLVSITLRPKVIHLIGGHLV